MGKWVRKGKFTDLSTKIFDQPFLIFPFRPFSRFLLIVSLNHLFFCSILFHFTVSISQPSIFLFYPVSFHCPYLSTVCFPFLSCFFPLSLSLNQLFSCSILFYSTVSISQPSIFLFYPVLLHCLYLSTIYFPVLSCFLSLSISLIRLFSFSILFLSTVSISQPSIFLSILFHSTVSISQPSVFLFDPVSFHFCLSYLPPVYVSYHIFLSSKLAPLSPVLLTHTLPIIYLPWSSISPSLSIYPSCLIKYNFSILLSTLDLKRFDLDQLIRGVKTPLADNNAVAMRH